MNRERHISDAVGSAIYRICTPETRSPRSKRVSAKHILILTSGTEMRDNVVIIGGGAAGLCAAVRLKMLDPSLSVRILEALPRVGKKLAATGNGRCNIINKKILPERYHGRHPEFCRYALEKYDNTVCEKFFSDIGVPFVFEGDKGYPASLQAASVVDCFRFAAEEYGVTVCTETKVTNIQISGGV